MTTLDLRPAARELADLVAGVRDDQLGDPTPCPAYSVGDLVDHVSSLAGAFARAARKDMAAAGPPPEPDVANLDGDWAGTVPADLEDLATSWGDPAAWDGTTRAGGLDMSGAEAGMVALDELVLHGWDLARATRQPFTVDPALLEHVHGFVASFAGEAMEEARDGLFGPVVDVHDDAPLLDRVVGLAGRPPDWSPPPT